MEEKKESIADIYVVDRIKRLGYEPNNKLSWGVGKQMQKLFEDENGYPPEKKLKRKVSGKGSHCMAAYPHHYMSKIDLAIYRTADSLELEPEP